MKCRNCSRDYEPTRKNNYFCDEYCKISFNGKKYYQNHKEERKEYQEMYLKIKTNRGKSKH